MTKIYLVRHGETKLNQSSTNSVDKIRGWSDIPLNDEGRKQAHKTGRELKALKNHQIKHIVSSDLKRAKETADIVGGHLKIKPKYDKGLRPWDLGEFTGQSSKTSMPKIKHYIDNDDKVVPKGESFKSFKKRAFGTINGIIRDHHGHGVVVVTHHRVERLLKGWIAKGRPANHDVDIDTFAKKGEPPGNHEVIHIDPPKGGSLRNAIKDSIKETKEKENVVHKS